MLRDWSEQAARPTAEVEERPDVLLLRLEMPGARLTNTDLVWDEDQRRLSVGVWAGPRPSARRRLVRPELAWYRSHWLPNHDGRNARATLNGNTLEIRVPRLGPPLARAA
jgi:HSP20 family molecular chaperone IbpA